MAFPFDYKARFSSVNHPDFSFSQSDFFRLRDFIRNKKEITEENRTDFNFALDRVFGVLNFNVKICFSEKSIQYKIDMIPAIFAVVAILFISMFITNSSIVISLIIGSVALVTVYTLSLLIVNGMVRKLIEDFVEKDMRKLNDNQNKKRCVKCGAFIDKQVSVCPVCGHRENKSSSHSGNGINIKYTYKESSKK